MSLMEINRRGRAIIQISITHIYIYVYIKHEDERIKKKPRENFFHDDGMASLESNSPREF